MNASIDVQGSTPFAVPSAMPPDLTVAARLIVVVTSAATILLIFATMSLPFAGSTLSSPSPEVVLLGAVVTVLVLPPVQSRAVVLARRLTAGIRLSPYDTLAQVATRLKSTDPIDEVIPRMVEVIEHGVGADHVDVRLRPSPRTLPGADDTETGTVHRAVIVHNGEPLAEIHVTKAGGLSSREIRLIDDIAASAAVVTANVATVSELEKQVAELTTIVAEIEESRRRMVVAEQDHRERLSRDVIVRFEPFFDRLRDAARDRRFDDAAELAESLLEQLRSVSTEVLRVGEDTG